MTSAITTPQVAFGTWQLDDTEAETVVAGAVDDGYRFIDSAQRYHNEYGVGRGVRASGVDRADVILTSKLRGGDHGREQTIRSFHASLRNLGGDYIDVYYIHWPLPRLDLYVESYETMMELRDQGLVKHLAVSNFNVDHLDRIKSELGEYPVVNQIELHPGFPQHEVVAGSQERGVHVQGWGVIGRGKGLLEKPEVTRIAAEHDATPAQVCLAWSLARNCNPLAKSANSARRRENRAAVDLTLTDRDLADLDALHYPRMSKDPAVDEEF